jgi:hypothetical protein
VQLRIFCRNSRCFTATTSRVAAPSSETPRSEMLYRDLDSSRGAATCYAAIPTTWPQSHPVLRCRELLGRKPGYFAATSSRVAAPRDETPRPQLLHRDPILSRGAAGYYAAIIWCCGVTRSDTATPTTTPRSHLESRRRQLIRRDTRYFAATPIGIAASQAWSPRSQILCRNTNSHCGAARYFTATPDTLPQSQMELRCRQIMRRDFISCCGISDDYAAIQDALPQSEPVCRELDLRHGPSACWDRPRAGSPQSWRREAGV